MNKLVAELLNSGWERKPQQSIVDEKAQLSAHLKAAHIFFHFVAIYFHVRYLSFDGSHFVYSIEPELSFYWS
jgi:hypothetical protein